MTATLYTGFLSFPRQKPSCTYPPETLLRHPLFPLSDNTPQYNPTIDPALLPDCARRQRKLEKQLRRNNRMLGGVAYETSQPTQFSGDYRHGWTMPRNKEHKGEHPGPSPTYSHLSPAESNAHSSPYPHPQTLVLPPGASYQMVYPQMMAPPGQRVQMTPGMTYYSGDHRELYQTPTPVPRNGKFTPYPPQYALPQVAYDGQGQLLPGQIGRSYDTTIPQYYPVTTDARWYGQQDGRVDPTPKRKRKESAQPSTQKSKSKPRSRERSRDSPVPKRAKHDATSPTMSQLQQNQLPTPPSTSQVTSMTLSSSAGVDDSPGASFAEPSTRRRGAFITFNAEEGRQLKVGTKESNDEIAVSRIDRSPRMTTIPGITTNANGLAVFSTDQVLESEMAWLEYTGHSPPSSPDAVVQTPTLPADNTSMLVEEQETPATRAEKTEKRLAMFTETDEPKDEAMVSTRIGIFGRVAVRKDVAIKFLGLDSSHSTSLVEETTSDDEGSWSARVDRPSSSKVVRPSWPDDEAPWALAGSSRKDKLARETRAKSVVLRRYLETASDDSSDEEDAPSRKGKAPQRYPDVSQRIWPNPHADAHTALLTLLRHRSLPPMRMGKIACACGATQAIGVNPMVECSGCRTYHHLACCGIGDEGMVGPQWWCPRCSAAAMAMSTPARTSTPRVYTQSDERSSAFKGEMANIALAPSPMFVNSSTFTQLPQHTPLARTMSSPLSRHKSRILSYGTDMWAYTEDGAPSSVAPSTPRPSRMDRFSTPRIEETPFDVTSTPSRHLDFNFGQPSLFSLTPLGARSRFGSTFLEATPFPRKESTAKSHLSDGISRHEFLKELGSGSTEVGSPVTPGTRWPHALMGAHNLSPSPFAARKASSGKRSSVRSTKSGLGLGMPLGAAPEEE